MAHFHNPNLAGAGGQGGYQIERSLRFNSADSAYLNRTPASAGNRKTFTISFWIKKAKTGGGTADDAVFTGNVGNGFLCNFRSDSLSLYDFYAASGGFQIWSARVFRDPSAWYHIVIAIDTTQATDSNRAKIYINGVQENLATWTVGAGASRYPSLDATFDWNNTNSHKIGYADTFNYLNGYLTEFHNIDGQALTPSSFGETNSATGVWQPKKYTGSYGTNGFYLKFAQNSIGVDLTSTATITAPFGGTAENARVSDSVYLISNTTTGSAFTLVQEDFGSVKQLSRYYIAAMYFTGGTSTFELQYSTNGSSWTTAASLSITASGQNFSGNINVNARYVRLQATAFGVNGQGGIDSLIIYQDPLGVDSSPNSNNWNVNNFSIVAGAGNDSLIDTPTPYADGGNGRGNYCTMNPLNLGSSYLSDGNLKHTGSGWGSTSGTMAVSTGKWYWEVTCDTYGGSNYTVLGIVSSTRTLGAIETGTLSDAYVYSNNGYKYNNNTGLAYGATYTTGDVIGVALDVGAGTVTFYKNGTSQGTAYSGLSGAFAPCLGCFTGGVLVANFGQRAFAYTPPSGFLALNTQNLPEPTIKKPERYVNAQIYTGTGAALTINTTIDPTADALIWTKMRSAAGIAGWDQHFLVDSKRIYAGNKYWQQFSTNSAGNEDANGDIVQSYTTSSITKNPIGPALTNESGKNYVMWSWQATASAGFDIVTYTGNGTNRTISHSLGVAPSMMIVKGRNTTSADHWFVWHSTLALGNTLYLNLTNGSTASSTVWNSTAPTSTVFTVGTAVGTNENNKNFVAYLWSEVAGFSKFGSYTGNGSSDGPFVFCNFRPRWLMIKRTDTTTNWIMYDTARMPYNTNPVGPIYANLSSAEEPNTTLTAFDILSNGFKPRNTSSWAESNASGGTYIFAAFAESPFKYSLAR